VAGVLAAVIPLTVVLSVALVREASDSLDRQARVGLQNIATQMADQAIIEFRNARRTAQVVARSVAPLDAAETQKAIQRDADLFEGLALVDPGGRLLAGDARAPRPDPSAEWFIAAARGASTFSPPQRRDGTIRTVVAEPVKRNGRTVAVVLGDMDERTFSVILSDLHLGKTGDATIRDSTGLLVWRYSEGLAPSTAAMVTHPRVLRERQTEGGAGRALEGRTGALTYTPSGADEEVVDGYAPIPATGWTVDVRQDSDQAFAPIRTQRNLAIVISLAGIALAILFALLFARRTVRPIRALAEAASRVAAGDLRVRAAEEGPDELRELAGSFNRMVEALSQLATEIRSAGAELASSAAELSSASQELAATTAQQTTASTETSTTIEELAATSSTIAKSVDDVARRTLDTREVLKRADDGLDASSQRTLALVERASEIGQIVTLINDIAERTNLLALNAAIEAARAGESGAGFAVVADEVRLLAERSKTEAKKISEIVARTQEETTATVVSMEGGSKEMRRGLELMDEIADATTEVRLSTDQQRVATDQVVEAMVSVSAGARQTATTADQIATSSSATADLAARLEDAAGRFSTAGGSPTGASPAPPEPDPAADERSV
jgi:methyl-accepting chemotaxis protein